MKKNFILVGIMILTISVIVSCKKTKSDEKKSTYTCTSCKQSPEGLAANDNSSKGIYKGVIIGSSGTIKFDISNTSSSTISAVLVIDGQTVNLTTTYTWVPGGIAVAPFKGTLNGAEVTINFSVGADGTGATVLSATIPGHPNSVFTLVKETSSSLARCFEGTYQNSAGEKGTFNIVVSTLLKGWTGKSRKNGSSEANNISGSFVNSILYWGSGTSTQVAPINGDNFSGSFSDGQSTVTVNGKRTL
jgi:hypothetical protein